MNLDNAIENAGDKITEVLTAIRESIGAPLGDYDITMAKLRQIIAPGELIVINGKIRLVYIKDHRFDEHSKGKRDWEIAQHGCYKSGNKLHFYNCTKLQEMGARQQRYRVAATIDRTQLIDLQEKENLPTRLAWCQYCVGAFQNALLEEQEFAQSDEHLVRNEWTEKRRQDLATDGDEQTLKRFSSKLSSPSSGRLEGIAFFFSTLGDFSRNLSPPATPTGLPENWSDISAAFRRERHYKCGICRVDCRDHTDLTDAHHINGNQIDCGYENLQCLCKYHHSQQPRHGHYKPTKAQMKTLRRLWQEQGIPDPSQKE